MSSIAVYGVMLAGWSSGSKYPLLGSVRASAQMVSYEAALGLAVLAVVLTAGTLSVNGIVSEQSTWGWNLWVTGLIPFVIFCLASTAELNRPPFDLVEAEQELVGSFQTEYSGFRFAIFYLAEFLNAITMAAIIVTLFLGGPNGPDLPVLPGWLWGFVFFFVKIIVILYVFVWVRASVPRVRYDQLMDLGWKLLIPLGLGWLLLLVAMRVASDEGWGFGGMLATAAAGVGIMAVCYGMLLLAMRIARRNRQLEGVID
jgi:NADH-quinone oxidoreductase subunit H